MGGWVDVVHGRIVGDDAGWRKREESCDAMIDPRLADYVINTLFWRESSLDLRTFSSNSPRPIPPDS